MVLGKDASKILAFKAANGAGAGGTRLEKKPDGLISQHFLARDTSMTYVALMLGLVTRKPVVDKTGLSGGFTFNLEFAPEDSRLGESSAPSIFTAVQEQLGLKLEAAKLPAEILVIDRAEHPSEN